MGGVDREAKLLLTLRERALEAHALRDVGGHENDRVDRAGVDDRDGAHDVGMVGLSIFAVAHGLIDDRLLRLAN